MAEGQEAIQEAVERGKGSRLNSLVAMCVALTATFMAICNVKDGNIVQAMEQAQARAVDQWSYYQAKGTKLHLAEQMVDQLKLQRLLLREPTPELVAALDNKIAEYQTSVTRYRDQQIQIKKAAEDSQKQYDQLNLHDDQFDAAEACFSVAIALLGVTALTQKRWLFVMGLLFAGFGAVLGLSGFLALNFHPEFLARLLG